MPTLAEVWKECQLIFGGNKYTGWVDPDESHMALATPAQMEKAAEQDGAEVKHPQFVQVYIDNWGHRMLPAEWVYIHGKPMIVHGGVPQQDAPVPKRKAPPPPVKRKAPPPPPKRKSA